MARLLLAFLLSAAAQADEVRLPHVRVDYDGVSSSWAEAVARLVESAREFYVSDFGFDMPDLVQVRVDCAERNSLRLWTDGEDRVTLTLRDVRQLAKPSESGVYMQFDDSATGYALVGLPGEEPRPFEKGTWMIRVELDSRRDADSLRSI